MTTDERQRLINIVTARWKAADFARKNGKQLLVEMKAMADEELRAFVKRHEVNDDLTETFINQFNYYLDKLKIESVAVRGEFVGIPAYLCSVHNMTAKQVGDLSPGQLLAIFKADVEAKNGAKVSAEGKPQIITASVASLKYAATQKTIQRAVTAGRLKDYRPAGHAKNAPLLVDENEVAAKWQKK